MDGGVKGKSVVSRLKISGVAVCVLLVWLAVETAAAEPNLVGWWAFDGGSGDIAYDSAGENDGTVYGAQWTSGQIGGALSFDGVDDYVSIPPLNLYTNTLTISAWIKRDGEQNWWTGLVYCTRNDGATWAGSVCIAGLSLGDEADWIGQPSSLNHLAYHWDTDVGWQWRSGLFVPDGEWTFAAVVIEPNQATMYMMPAGGDQYSAVNYQHHIETTFDQRWTIGKDERGDWGGNRCFDGQIDDVRIYNRALTSEEIMQLYREGSVRAFGPNPVDGATRVDPDVVLSWSPGKDAASHDVYFGTDYNDVKDATTGSAEYMGNQDANSYYPRDELEFWRTYYWRIDEVNDANTNSPWKGNVWSFGTAGERVIDRAEYADRLRALWLGECIANWTGLQTEGWFTWPPFLTDAYWGPGGFYFVLDQDPWWADDDTDIEYVYCHLLDQHRTNELSSEQIREGWMSHINRYIWVSNERARSLMNAGYSSPQTGMLALNGLGLMIDAQLTTEVFGALAPRMPGMALEMADLPIRTTATGYAAHAAQYFVLLYCLASEVDPMASRKDQVLWLADEARKYIPDTSKSADIYDFVKADYLANSNKDDWESTRDKICYRYQLNAASNGFRYQTWYESSINLASTVMALLYGEGDYKKTVKIGTLSGWDSDCSTATLGGLLGFMYGYSALVAEFSGTSFSDRYWIKRTRDNMPDYLPDDSRAEDTLAMLADRMLEIIDRTVWDAGGMVDDKSNLWVLPAVSSAVAVEQNPLYGLMQRSANNRVRQLGGTVTPASSVPVSSYIEKMADGFEHNFGGEEWWPASEAWFYSTRQIDVHSGEIQTLSVTYDEPVEVSVIRYIEGSGDIWRGGWFTSAEVEVEMEGSWQIPPGSVAASETLQENLDYQIIDYILSEPVQATAIRIRGPVGGPRGYVTALELDAFAFAGLVVKPDKYWVIRNMSLSVSTESGVLANDDSYSGPLTAVLVSGPVNGSVSLNADGSFEYMPDSGFEGTDSFTYKVSWGNYESDVCPVYIVVRRPLRVPAEYGTVQAAIDAAVHYDTVVVADGTYTGEGNRDIDFRGKVITVRSENGPENCIIDCNGTGADPHRGFYFHSGEGGDCVLDGFTIRNGFGPEYESRSRGGGILCVGSSPTIRDCVVRDNVADFRGGGIYCGGGDPTITSCTMMGNSGGSFGGGIYSEHGSPTITQCAISSNTAERGGAVYCRESRATINNCIMRLNRAGGRFGGSGIVCRNSEVTISNCVIGGNGGTGIKTAGSTSMTIGSCTIVGNGGYGIDRYGSDATITNCIIQGNYGDAIYGSGQGVTYSNVEGGYAGEGNIDADPCFVDAGYWDGNGTAGDVNDDFWVDGNYHLRGDSPCIDAGTDAGVYEDIEGNERPYDYPGVDNNGELAEFDMGAYEAVLRPVEVGMHFTPRTLNPKSMGKWMKAHIVLPEGFSVEDVDVNTPAVIEPVGIESEYINVFVNEDGFVELEIGFSRGAFCDCGIDYGPAEVTVVGKFVSGQEFIGRDAIKILANKLRGLASFASYWLQTCRRGDWCGGADVDRNLVVDFVDFALFEGCWVEVIAE